MRAAATSLHSQRFRVVNPRGSFFDLYPNVRFILDTGTAPLPVESYTVKVDTQWDPAWLKACVHYLTETLTPAQRITALSLSSEVALIIWRIYAEDGDNIDLSLDHRGETLQRYIETALLYRAPTRESPGDPTDWVQWALRRPSRASFTAAQRRHLRALRRRYKEDEDELLETTCDFMRALPAASPLWKEYRAFSLEDHVQDYACLWPQIAAVMGCALEESAIARVWPRMTAAHWHRIMRQYREDVQALIAGAPPLPRAALVYRRAKEGARARRLPHPAVVKASRLEVEERLDDDEELHVARIPAGGRLLPLWVLMSLNPEYQEVAVARGTRFARPQRATK